MSGIPKYHNPDFDTTVWKTNGLPGDDGPAGPARIAWPSPRTRRQMKKRGLARCHHCGGTLRKSGRWFVHAVTGREPCGEWEQTDG